MGHLEELYAQHVQEGDADPPHDLWSEGLDAKPEHVRMWCKFKARKPTRQSQPGTAPVAETPSHMTEERSQLPTPGTSTSPEPPPPPDAIKGEPPVSPVVGSTALLPLPGDPKEKSSFGLHEAIEIAFFGPPAPSTQPPESPLSTTLVNQQRNPSPRNRDKTTHALSPLSIPANNATVPTSAALPPVSIASPHPQFEPSPPPQHHEPSVPPSPEESIPVPSTQPDRDIARERAHLVTGVAAKLDELNVIFSSTHGLAQIAGSIQDISKRNKQFLNDVAAGRFAHLHLTGAHIPNPQVAGPMSEFNPLRTLAEWQDSKGRGNEKEGEDGMEVD